MSYTSSLGTRAIIPKQSAAQTFATLHGSSIATSLSRPAFVTLRHQWTAKSHFTTSRPSRIRDFFPAPDAPNIRTTEAAWPHPVYTQQQMDMVKPAHRATKDLPDRIALLGVKLLRFGLDTATFYRHDDGKGKYTMSEKKWMVRNVFLESVAGVPGMVAGMLRHLHSMRRMKRDNGWIETLLEESYNERVSRQFSSRSKKVAANFSRRCTS